MSASITQLFTRFADALMQGRIDHIVRNFAYPLPVYLKEDLIVMGKANAMAEALCLYRDAMLRIGVVKIRPRVVAQGLPRRGYSHVWIEWDHLDAEGNCLRTNQARYSMHQGPYDLHPCVELIDYTVTAFPELSQELPLAQSA